MCQTFNNQTAPLLETSGVRQWTHTQELHTESLHDVVEQYGVDFLVLDGRVASQLVPSKLMEESFGYRLPQE